MLAVMALLYLLLGSMMAWGNALLRWFFNLELIAAALLIFYLSGMTRGAGDVNQGEMMYDREQAGRTVSDQERAACYHPAKGIVIALLGSLPFLIATVVFALLAQKQYTSIGVLPSWVSALETREEISAPLAFYAVVPPLTAEQLLRILIRVITLPWVNLLAPYGADVLLTFERLTPLVLLLPALCYGFGYFRGTEVRDEVHTSIAANTRQRQRRDQRRRRQRQAQPKGPQQLN